MRAPVTATVFAIMISGLCWYFANALSGKFWYLLWAAPIPVLLVSFQLTAGKAFLIAFTAYLVGRLSWVPYLLTVLPTALAIFFTVLLPLIFALIILLTRKIVLRKQSGWSAFALPVFWSSFEFLGFKFSPDGTAGSIAYSQSNFLPVIQVASVTGILGITFVVTLFSSALAVGIYYRFRKMTLPLSIIFSLIFFSIFFGIIRINRNPSTDNKVTVGLAVLDEKFHSETNHPVSAKEIAIANLYANEITRLAQQGAQIAVLPEKMVNVTPLTNTVIKQIFLSAAIKNHVAIVAGYTNFLNDSIKQNKALVISPVGVPVSDYTKVNLFEGEARNGFVRGNPISVFNLNNIPSGVTICKDMDYPDFIRQYGRHHIEVLFVPAWDFIRDGWLHARMAILRGVEDGFATVRAARQGELTISDYTGKVLYETSSTNNNASAFTATFVLHDSSTIYTRSGDWFGIINLAAAISFAFFLLFTRRNTNNRVKLSTGSHKEDPR
ncbi:MAG TPA: nitrilase-related carbon-nitrogen hydrolase [Chitinophagaceae bacterium]|nr:nitrilase-related carbon-nitrogen hydrolase [Chitinophagaceae bacterium]